MGKKYENPYSLRSKKTKKGYTGSNSKTTVKYSKTTHPIRNALIAMGILFLIVVLILAFIQVKQENTPITKMQDAKTMKQIVEFAGATYISEDIPSKESDYVEDVFLSFLKAPYENNQDQRLYYDGIIKGVSYFLNFKNYRLIDKTRGITVTVKGNGQSIIEIKINDLSEDEFFNKQISENSRVAINETNFTYNSELETLVKNEWNLKNLNFGTQTSTFDNYNIYFDKGFKFRQINNKIFNFVFTKKYTGEVINNIKVGTPLEDVKSILGDNCIDKTAFVEYMGKDFYVCFSTDEISVYPRINYDYSTFETLLTNYNQTHDFNSFMNQLTGIWPDYSHYEYDSNMCDIWYPLKGIRIQKSSQAQNGIKIYMEYAGNFATNKVNYYDVYYDQTNSMIATNETNRNNYRIENPNYTNGNYVSEKYGLYWLKDQGKIGFYSLDGSNADSELNRINIGQMYWMDDSQLLYSEPNKGIYVYNADTREVKVLKEDSNANNITNYDKDENILTVDGKDIKING